MGKSASEDYLEGLANRTFLKLWAIPNAFYAPGKELSDLVVPFGEDVVIVSDKASLYPVGKPAHIAWRRWRGRAIDEGVRQVGTAMQRIARNPEGIYTDARASSRLQHAAGVDAPRRFHLVAIARPSRDPQQVPSDWPGFTYTDATSDRPFEISPVRVGDATVHVFDGPTIDLLLDQLDTAPDFIAYLRGRAERLAEPGGYRFMERDLLAASLIGWEDTPTGLPSVPPLETAVPGIWNDYAGSDRAMRRLILDRPSRIIDRIIAQHHGEFAAGRVLGGTASFRQHEHAMRLLAAESRFARRMVAHELHDILSEPDQSTFWASTIASPTYRDLRYLWLIHPDAPEEIDTRVADAVLQDYLEKHVLVTQALFPERLVMGIAVPSMQARDRLIAFALHDKSTWTEVDVRNALELRDLGILAELDASTRAHVR